MPIIIAIAAFAFTTLGGLFALRFKDKLHLILGFSAGAVIGVAFFDLIPEAIKLGTASGDVAGVASGGHDISFIMSVVALGFILYMVLDRFVILHSHHHEDEHVHTDDGRAHQHPSRGFLGAGSLSIHSFIDGIAVGLALQVSVAVGAIVAVAVLVHDFSDGINTVNLILKNNGDRKTAFKWLLIDAVAPVLGIIVASFFSVQESTLGIVLAAFAGFFLYIGASDLLPESHHNHPTIWTTCATIFGVVVLFMAIRLAGI